MTDDPFKGIYGSLLPCPSCDASVGSHARGAYVTGRFGIKCCACGHVVESETVAGVVAAWNGDREAKMIQVDGESRAVEVKPDPVLQRLDRIIELLEALGYQVSPPREVGEG